jgi:hypothetical protein
VVVPPGELIATTTPETALDSPTRFISIVARETSLVGSIGVLFQYPEVSGLLDKVGVKVEDSSRPACAGCGRALPSRWWCRPAS